METIRKLKKTKVKLPEPSEELKKLQVFVGKWIVEGQNLSADPIAPNTEVAGVQTYDWLPGNFFLVGKWDRQFDNSENIGIGMLGFDVIKDEFFRTNYDNLGSAKTFHVDCYRNIWKLRGEKERATIIFSSDGQTFIEDWEILKDEYNWQPLCALRNKKIK
ncbi:MAG TPA: DUF1579 family protein [Bacteroidia bacterium]|jgi:hypothetical protein|nr:DUF1579 family protein [Bacteroidia bacterium]